MEIIKTSIFCLLIFLGIALVPACSSDDSEDPCQAFECFNGGVKTVSGSNCTCDCPSGYTGVNCEIEIRCVDITCPEGQTPNPGNDCQCE